MTKIKKSESINNRVTKNSINPTTYLDHSPTLVNIFLTLNNFRVFSRNILFNKIWHILLRA